MHREAEINVYEIFDDALQAAAMKDHITVVKFMIDEDVNVNQQNDFYDTALQAAAYHNQHDVVTFLLDADANVHATGYCRNAFHAAAEKEHSDVIMLMLQKNYKFCLSPSIYKYTMKISSRCETLMQNASSDRNCDRYERKKSF